MTIHINQLKINLRFILIIILFCQTSFCYAALSVTEKNIRDTVNKTQSNRVALLKKIVDIPSSTNNIHGIYQVGHVVEKELQQIGFITHWEREAEKLHRAGTLIAKRSGTQGKHLLLIAHLDTVSENNSFVLRKNSAKGAGINDDKGGVVVLLSTLKTLHRLHLLDNTNITIALTGDEEDTGKPTSISRKALLAASLNQDIALDFEPAPSLNAATIARRGVTHWKIISQGVRSHSASILNEDTGAGAIFEIVSILDSMRMKLRNELNIFFNPGLIIGGTNITENLRNNEFKTLGKHNVVADTAIAMGDFRFIDHQQKNAIEHKMQDIVNAHLAKTKSLITFEDGMPAMIATANNYQLLALYNQISLDLNTGKIIAISPLLRGAADISYVADKVSASLSGLGPEGFGAHTNNESIDLTSLNIQTLRAAILINRLTHS